MEDEGGEIMNKEVKITEFRFMQMLVAMLSIGASAGFVAGFLVRGLG